LNPPPQNSPDRHILDLLTRGIADAISGTSGTRAPQPFFTAGSFVTQRRLLLISYHFPPSQSVGALRWQKLSQLAVERGWEMDVVTAHPSSLNTMDLERLKELPPGTRVYGVPVLTSLPERLERWGLKFWRSAGGRKRASGTTPTASATPSNQKTKAESLGALEIWRRWDDPRSAYHAFVHKSHWYAWARTAAAIGEMVIQPGSHGAVISCGPPHEAHRAARRISISTGLPFVMDMRDPWSMVERLPEAIASPVWLWTSARDERHAVAQAAIVSCNTEPSSRALIAAYPHLKARVITVTNGYDEERLPPTLHGTRFSIAYAGSIYLDRDPRLLFRAAALVIADIGIPKERFGLDFIGNVENYNGLPVTQIAREEGIAQYVTVGPSRARQEMLKFLANATMLVSLPQDSDLAIPSKIFEYMQFDAWLLALANRGSATELLLRDSEAHVISPNDVDAMAAVLRERYQQYARGVRPLRIARDPRFSRRGQAKILFDALDEVVASPG